MWQVVLANDDFDIHAEIILIAENLNHSSARTLCSCRPVGDLNINNDVFQIAPVFWPRSFFAQHTVFGGSSRWSLVVRESLPGLAEFFCAVSVRFPMTSAPGAFANDERPTTNDGFISSGYSIPYGITICCEIF